MITHLTGKLTLLYDDWAGIETGPFVYEVFIPEFARRQLQGKVGEEVRFYTIEYIEGNAAQGGRLTPRIVGFLSPAEREFFELFCSVDGVGVKKALRAMVRPVRDIAAAIEEQNAKTLSALPGIGPASAERIIAKLRRKVPKFALMIARDDEKGGVEIAPDIVGETYEALLSLGHSESDARRLIDKALESKKKFKDVQELLMEIYQQQR